MIRVEVMPGFSRFGEPGGRALVADELGGKLRRAPLAMGPTLNSWTDLELGAVSVWLRDVVVGVSAAIDVDPADFCPHDGLAPWRGVHGWAIAHRFLCGDAPADGDGIRICCHSFLMDMTAVVAHVAVEALLMEWKDDPGVEAHVINGGPLPALPSRVPAFTPAAAPAPAGG